VAFRAFGLRQSPGWPGDAEAASHRARSDPVEGRFRSQILASLGQNRHDLAGRQRGKLGRIGYGQHGLALLLTEFVRGNQLAATTTVFRDLTRLLPPLQRAQGDPQ
jgi:hypothetical protein